MDPKPRKTPVRSCISCRTAGDKRALLRFVRDAQGEVSLDPSGKAPGRGAYVCPNMDCFKDARRKHRLNSALKVALTDDDYARLEDEFQSFVVKTDER